MTKLKPETLCIHGGYQRDDTKAITLPIYQSTAFAFDNADHGASLFDLKQAGNIYSRLTNPTWDTLGEKINILEGGVGALTVSSGQTASTFAVLNICNAGDHILAAQNLYGGTFTLFQDLERFGITTTFMDTDASIDEISKHIQPKTKCIFTETIGNPLGAILDFDKFSKLSKYHKIPLIVDNTFASPYLFRPLDYGANIVVHSATKYLGGHGNALAGVIVDGGNFEWDSEKYPEFFAADPAYHGLSYHESFGSAAYIVKIRAQLLRNVGATLSPFNAFLVHTGMETLHIRMKAHSENALQLAKFLQTHPKVDWVAHPLLETHQDYLRAKEYFPRGSGGLFAFGVKGNLEQTKTFIDALGWIIHASNLGDVRTIVSHPASTTHRQMSDQDRKNAGIEDNLIRISTGIEHIDDITLDIDQALNKIT